MSPEFYVSCKRGYLHSLDSSVLGGGLEGMGVGSCIMLHLRDCSFYRRCPRVSKFISNVLLFSCHITVTLIAACTFRTRHDNVVSHEKIA